MYPCHYCFSPTPTRGAWSRCKALSETFFPCYWGSMNLWWGLMLFNLLLFHHTWEGFTMLPFCRSNRKAKEAGFSSGSKRTCEEMHVSCSFLSVSALLSSKKVNKSWLNALVVPLCISKQHLFWTWKIPFEVKSQEFEGFAPSYKMKPSFPTTKWDD